MCCFWQTVCHASFCCLCSLLFLKQRCHFISLMSSRWWVDSPAAHAAFLFAFTFQRFSLPQMSDPQWKQMVQWNVKKWRRHQAITQGQNLSKEVSHIALNTFNVSDNVRLCPHGFMAVRTLTGMYKLIVAGSCYRSAPATVLTSTLAAVAGHVGHRWTPPSASVGRLQFSFHFSLISQIVKLIGLLQWIREGVMLNIQQLYLCNHFQKH